HGMMIAMLALGSMSYQEAGVFLQNEIPTLSCQRINELFNALLVNSAQNLAQEHNLILLLPQDDESLAVRIEGMRSWCEGFIDGVHKANVASNLLCPLIKEVIDDIVQLRSVSTDVIENEENEKDYTEIVEFIRVSVLLIYEQAKQNQKIAKQLH
ncbi:MAG: UPF0149 family protein, partial [Candidatus Berkiella sp.]